MCLFEYSEKICFEINKSISSYRLKGKAFSELPLVEAGQVGDTLLRNTHSTLRILQNVA